MYRPHQARHLSDLFEKEQGKVPRTKDLRLIIGRLHRLDLDIKKKPKDRMTMIMKNKKLIGSLTDKNQNSQKNLRSASATNTTCFTFAIEKKILLMFLCLFRCE
jgi:hypothetical protein